MDEGIRWWVSALWHFVCLLIMGLKGRNQSRDGMKSYECGALLVRSYLLT